jgi:hypothetical protein
LSSEKLVNATAREFGGGGENLRKKCFKAYSLEVTLTFIFNFNTQMIYKESKNGLACGEEESDSVFQQELIK